MRLDGISFFVACLAQCIQRPTEALKSNNKPHWHAIIAVMSDQKAREKSRPSHKILQERLKAKSSQITRVIKVAIQSILKVDKVVINNDPMND